MSMMATPLSAEPHNASLSYFAKRNRQDPIQDGFPAGEDVRPSQNEHCHAKLWVNCVNLTVGSSD